MKAALHVDQLFFTVPGGVGTYIRNLLPALARRDPSLLLTATASPIGPHRRRRRSDYSSTSRCFPSFTSASARSPSTRAFP